jgi:diguanylate cyclase (GGDEF)-like protein/PAS domain S-box-containing protein
VVDDAMRRVLAVEDSPTQAEVLRSDLEAAGFEVTVARNGAEALQRLEEDGFDIVVSDVVMPGMSGYDLCRTVKASPAMHDIPVILLTSLTDPLDVVNGLESGADNFLRKPYQPAQLVARINATSRNRELRRSGEDDTGVRLAFLEREFEIKADRPQMLDLLVSTFEELVMTSRQVRAREEELIRAHAELQKHLQAVDLERNRLQAVVDSVPVPLFVVAPEGQVSHASEASARVFGTSQEEMRGRQLDDVVRFVDAGGAPISPEALPHHRAQQVGGPVSTGAAFDVFFCHPSGKRLPVVLEASPVRDDRGEWAGSVGTAHVLGALTQHDPVTGLPNNMAYLERVAGLVSSSRGDAALLLLELDRYDVTRAALGHQGANEMLVDVARRLRHVFEPTHGTASHSECFLACLGSSRFGILLENLPGSFSVVHLAEAARRAVSESAPAREGVRLTASVGVALSDSKHDGSQLFTAASVALRRASATGGDHVELFGQEASQDAMDRLQLEIDLREAVENVGIELHYQPEVDLETGELIGFEALARWRHPRLGPIGPDVFITLAEESGLILPLGRQLFRAACVAATRWPVRPDGRPLSVAVNVSAVQLRGEIVSEVISTLEETGLAPRRLIIEVTETAAMTKPAVTLPLLEELRRHGVRVSLDDFGTGYSSMALLTRVHFDQLKLDRGFVAGIQQGGRDMIIAQSIVSLGDSLGVPVLAEGIETRKQLDLLCELGCAQGQGYLFARPMSSSAVGELFAELAGSDFRLAP